MGDYFLRFGVRLERYPTANARWIVLHDATRNSVPTGCDPTFPGARAPRETRLSVFVESSNLNFSMWPIMEIDAAKLTRRLLIRFLRSNCFVRRRAGISRS